MTQKQTVQRFTPRAGSRAPGALRRALDGGVESGQRFNPSMAVDKDGRLGTQLARNGGLKMTRDGLAVDIGTVGDKNHDMMKQVPDLSSSAALSDVISRMNTLLDELRRTKRLRG